MKYIYKIIAAVMAFIIVPVAVFTPVFYYKVQSTALEALFYLGQKQNSETVKDYYDENGKLPDTIYDSLSVYKALNVVSKLTEKDDSKEVNENLKEAGKTLIAPAITTAVFWVLINICAVLTAVFAIVSRNNRKVIYSSLAGIGLSVAFSSAFNSLVAPILDKRISLQTITTFNPFVSSLIANVKEIALTPSFRIIPALFVLVAVWTVLYNVTLPEKEKLERKRMLGEYKEDR